MTFELYRQTIKNIVKHSPSIRGLVIAAEAMGYRGVRVHVGVYAAGSLNSSKV